MSLPEPPPELISRVANELGDPLRFLRAFRKRVGLRPEDDVLDLGCGVGRAALGLKDYLTGRYEGLDIDAELIGWCREHITPAHPNFNFTHADVFNGAYHPTGFERYLSETRRVLRHGGRTLFSFFLLRPRSRAVLARGGPLADALLARDRGDFSTPYDRPESLVAYRLGFVRRAYERNGFNIREFGWAIGERPDYTQDYIVAVGV
jgi:SAM-dependent methyltransferase